MLLLLQHLLPLLVSLINYSFIFSDLTRNYLNGSIPPEWGASSLLNISLLGNRISGSIPKELGNLTTLSGL